jgi:hypothetical protein
VGRPDARGLWTQRSRADLTLVPGETTVFHRACLGRRKRHGSSAGWWIGRHMCRCDSLMTTAFICDVLRRSSQSAEYPAPTAAWIASSLWTASRQGFAAADGARGPSTAALPGTLIDQARSPGSRRAVYLSYDRVGDGGKRRSVPRRHRRGHPPLAAPGRQGFIAMISSQLWGRDLRSTSRRAWPTVDSSALQASSQSSSVACKAPIAKSL